MNTTQKTPVIDCWAIYNELVKTQNLERRAEMVARSGIKHNGMMVIDEYASIGMRIPRQCGKTRFVQEFMDKHPQALAVVTNLHFRDDLIARCKTDISDRIMTAADFDSAKMREQPNWLERIRGVTHVIVDESRHVYERTPRKWIYTLICQNPNIIVVEIN